MASADDCLGRGLWPISKIQILDHNSYFSHTDHERLNTYLITMQIKSLYATQIISLCHIVFIMDRYTCHVPRLQDYLTVSNSRLVYASVMRIVGATVITIGNG